MFRLPSLNAREVVREAVRHACTDAVDDHELSLELFLPLVPVMPDLTADSTVYVLGLLGATHDLAARLLVEAYAGHANSDVREAAADALAELAGRPEGSQAAVSAGRCHRCAVAAAAGPRGSRFAGRQVRGAAGRRGRQVRGAAGPQGGGQAPGRPRCRVRRCEIHGKSRDGGTKSSVRNCAR
ncbi:hypothetical protein Afe05nite_16120 [Paractinoplanes ferrugineus]|uniref:HEAT repeat protein n=1 Tax=Paractinoplanes ferrugineus TaxID=113564 RepID=A0A919IXT9_9ACTN|nr:hypothetical protein Afe05nite_16120 [Actinoplanes ferrugineus]